VRVPSSPVLASWAVALVATGFGLMLLLHVLEPRLSPVTTYLSDYGETPHRGLLLAAYVLTGVGGILLGASLRGRLEGSLAAGAGGALLALAGAAFLGMVVWPVGAVHVGIVRIEEGMLLLGVGLTAYGLQDRVSVPSFSIFSAILVFMTILGVIRVESWVSFPGVVQRVYVVTIFAWVVAAARVAMQDEATRRPSAQPHP